MFECNICNKSFNSQKALNGHNTSVHTNRPKLERVTITKVCPKCSNTFEVERKISKIGKEQIPKKEKQYCNIQCANSIGGNTINGIFMPKNKIKFCGYCNIEIKRKSYKTEISFCCKEHAKLYNYDLQLKIAKEYGWNKVTTKPGTVRKILLYERSHKCEICNETQWTGKSIPLVMDHIDGNSDNWSYNNLRLICRNCDGLLPTFAGRNVGKHSETQRMKAQKERFQSGRQQHRKVA